MKYWFMFDGCLHCSDFHVFADGSGKCHFVAYNEAERRMVALKPYEVVDNYDINVYESLTLLVEGEKLIEDPLCRGVNFKFSGE